SLNPDEWVKAFKKPPEVPTGPMDSLVLRGGDLEKDKAALETPANPMLEGAHQLRKQEEYAKAAKAFNYLAENKKNPLPVIEEALFYEAECYYQQKEYRYAQPIYKKLLGSEFRYGRFQDQACKRLFEIADIWLEPTRQQIRAYEEKRKGERWVVLPASYFHVSSDKPWMDMEGHALVALEAVRLHDIKGPLGEKALMMIATVKAFHEDYREADYYFTELYKHFPNGPMASEAIKRAIICKQMMTGGSAYDTRVLQEAQQLVQAAKSYPDLADDDFLKRQLISIGNQQADRDFNIGEFYRRIGHPGPAYFYYELVLRTYPGSKYAERAEERKREMQARLERQGKSPLSMFTNLFSPAVSPQAPAPGSPPIVEGTPGSAPTGPVPGRLPADLGPTGLPPTGPAPTGPAPTGPAPTGLPPTGVRP